MIYFDYTATTPINPEVLNTYIKTQTNFYANTNSLHKLGQMSNFMFEKATNEFKEVVGLENHNIVYTSNATEANNLGIFGYVEKYKSGKVITSKIEHPSVFEVFKVLESKGYDVVYLDVDKEGIINLDQLEKELDKDVLLVSIMWVNNIVGSIQPIKKVIDLVKKNPKIKLHVDIVQGICKFIPDFSFNDIDLLTLSGHKIYAPKGIGVLAIKNNLDIEARIFGANNQFKIKPGTLDLALVVALCKAVKIFYPQIEEHLNYVKQLSKYLRERLEKIKKIEINSPINASPYIMNISVLEIQGETLLHYLEEAEIYISTGSACASKFKKPEKTIYAMTNSYEHATTAARISLSHLTTFKEIDKLVEVLEKL
ncbi:MAG: cysteine desulfurase family protein [Bacilli bacterium]|nr:cysteine desulfurase [Bacilli bacterium]